MASDEQTIVDLRELVAAQSAQLKRYEARIEQLELELAKLKKDSSTSSKPPSSDIVKPRKKHDKPGRPKKRKRGGQPGHERKLREPLPRERVDETIDYEIKDSEVARLGLTPTDRFESFQHIELPESPVHVTEHRLRVYVNSVGEEYLPNVPEVTSGSIFGPRLLATIGWLKSGAHCSYSTIETWMEDVLSVPVSRGYLAKLCTGMISNSVQGAYEELVDAIPRQPHLASDETSLKNNGKKHWVWCIAATAFTVFHIDKTRARKVLERLVGDEFAGYLNFDYFSANCSFVWHYCIKAQYCWAHLIRDIRFLTKQPDRKTKAWADKLLDESRRLFSAYHRRDEMSAEGYHRSMTMHRNRFVALIAEAPDCKEATNLAARFAMVEYPSSDGTETLTYDLSEDYFRFMFVDGVEPTNNHGEQQIRHCVIDRLITQGTRSEVGQRFNERMWTARATCTKQGRSFYAFLHDSIKAKLNATPAPSLLQA